MSFDTTHFSTHSGPDVSGQTHGILPGGCIHPNHDPQSGGHPGWPYPHPVPPGPIAGPIAGPHHLPFDANHHAHDDIALVSGPSHVVHHDHHLGSTTVVHTCNDQILMK